MMQFVHHRFSSNSLQTFRDLETRTTWQVVGAPPNSGHPSGLNVVMRPGGFGRRLRRPAPNLLSIVPNSMLLPEARPWLNRERLRGHSPEIATFLVVGQVVYATPVPTTTRHQYSRFNISRGRVEIAIDTLLRSGLPPVVKAKVTGLAKRLSSRFSCCRNAEEDLIQDFTLAVLEAMPRYTSARGEPIPFMNGVLDFEYMSKLRTLRQRSNLPFTHEMPDPDLGEHSRLVIKHDWTCSQERRTFDVDAALARMPVQSRYLSKLVMHSSMANAAKLTGLNRTGLYEKTKRLGKYFSNNLSDYL